jgi:hypothetical protein
MLVGPGHRRLIEDIQQACSTSLFANYDKA